MSQLDEPRAVVAGSRRRPLPEAERGAAIDPAAQISVTVVLRRPSSAPSVEAGRAALTHQEFEEQHGADPDDVARVEAFAERYGITVGEVHRAARTITLTGTAETLQQAFGTTLHHYDSPAGQYRGREGELSVPEDVSDAVVAVVGLDDRPQVRPHLQRVQAVEVAEAAAPAAPASFTTPDLATLYGFPPDVDGTGYAIGILEFGGGYLTADNAAYFAALHLPKPSIVAVSVDRAHNKPGSAANPDPADGEVALDIQVAGAAAPGAKQAVYFAPNTDKGFIDAVTHAVHDRTHKPSVISISWGAPEDAWSAQTRNALDAAFQDAAALGVTVLVAAGDHGSADEPPTNEDGSPNRFYDGHAHVDFPAASPNVLACGGTHLEAAHGSISSETVWNNQDGWATGGGVSQVFPQPSWQHHAGVPTSVNPGGTAGRGVPDVAGNADGHTGYRVRLYGRDVVIGGTSAVAPLWAGLTARLDQAAGRRLGNFAPLLYANPAGAFRDITTGSNAIPAIAPQPATAGYSAHAGWDPCTGLGSPNGAGLRTLLA